MRLPEAKIREAIVHPDKLVRREALEYFTDCYSRDTEVMPLAIKAIEAYGRRDAFWSVDRLAQLAQTEATIEWAIREIHREEATAREHDRYLDGISGLLCNADPQLLQPQADDILRAPGFSADWAGQFQERLTLVSWDADHCWQELERICAAGVGADVEWNRASLVVDALARRGNQFVDRILKLLAEEVEDFETDPKSLLQIFLVELAGEMRLERAVPSIVKKLRLCQDGLLEESAKALGKIGIDAGADAVAEDWPNASWEYRLFAINALEWIHSDTTVRKCLELLPQEKELDLRANLAFALLNQYADEGIEPVREMLKRRAYNAQCCDPMEKLVGVSPVLGVTFPEYPIWKREVEVSLAKQERRMKEYDELPNSPPALMPARATDNDWERKPTPIVRAERSVGRNDPCPCGSGKKFKKCCMTRAQ